MKISPILQNIAKHYALFSAKKGITANSQKSDLVLGMRIDDLPTNRRDGLYGFYIGPGRCLWNYWGGRFEMNSRARLISTN
jgi:hypothetical protein